MFPIVWKYPDVSLNTRSSFTLTNADVLSWTVNSHLPQLCHYTQVMSAWCDTYCRSFAKISVVCRKILSVWLSCEEGSSVCVSGAEVERVNSFRFFCHHTSPPWIQENRKGSTSQINFWRLHPGTRFWSEEQQRASWLKASQPGPEQEVVYSALNITAEHQRHQWTKVSTQRQRER